MRRAFFALALLALGACQPLVHYYHYQPVDPLGWALTDTCDISCSMVRRILELRQIGVVFAQTDFLAHQEISHTVRQIVIFWRFRR